MDPPISIDTNGVHTRVEFVDLWHDGGVIGIGEVIRLRVYFSDKVFCTGQKPEILLNTASTAIYESGTGTKVLTFVMQTTIADAIQTLSWTLFDDTNSAIICAESSALPCSIANGNHDLVDLSFVDNEGNALIPPLSPSI